MINKVTLIGHLGQDPELHRLENGTAVARLSLATTDAFKDKNGEWQNQTEWHNVVVWRELAERAEKLLKKGSFVYVEGKLTHRKYTDKNGIERIATDVVANTVRNLEKKEGSSFKESQMPSEEPSNNSNVEKDVFFEMPTIKVGRYEKASGTENTIIVKSVDNDYVHFTSTKKGDAIQKMLTSEFEVNVLRLYNFVEQNENSSEASQGDDLPF